MKHILLLLLLTASPAAAQWTPPMGIPVPPFGITDVAGAPTKTVASSSPLPTSLAPGDVVAVLGNRGDVRLTANCTQAKPCYLQGGTYHTLSVTGDYFILENLTAYNPDFACSAHCGIRHSTIGGDKAGGGIFSAGDYRVIWDNYIHDVGDVAATSDVDRHGAPIGTQGHHIWVVNNRFERIGGDAVQINAWTDPPAGLHHIYIGGNTASGTRQTCFWAKQSVDVVMSENQCAHQVGVGSGGARAGIGSQYGSLRLVLLANRIVDTSYGIAIRSSSDGVPNSTLAALNVIADTVASSGSAGPTQNSQADGAAIMAMGSGPQLFMNNTLVRARGGIQLPGGAGPTDLVSNLFSAVTNPIVIETSSKVTDTQNFKSGDPKFASSTDFTLGLGSPAKGAGVAVADSLNLAYQRLTGQTYRAVHGIDLPVLPSPPDQGAMGPALTPIAGTSPLPTPVPPPPPPPTPVPTPTPTPTPPPVPPPVKPLCSSLHGWAWLVAVITSSCR